MTLDLFAARQFGQERGGDVAAWPTADDAAMAGLAVFRGINAFEADARRADFDGVAIDDARDPSQRRVLVKWRGAGARGFDRRRQACSDTERERHSQYGTTGT